MGWVTLQLVKVIRLKLSESTSLNISGTYMLPEENPVNLELVGI